MSDKYLVVGCDGLIGGALLRQWVGMGVNVRGTSRREITNWRHVQPFDLSKPIENPLWIRSFNIAVIVACIPGEKLCSADKTLSRFVNVTQTIELARRLSEHGCFVIVVGSSHVFSGDKPRYTVKNAIEPQGEYGRQKAEVEQPILAMGGAVIRATKVFHKGLHIFRDWRRDDAIKGIAFTDYFLSPVSLGALCETVDAVARGRKAGIWHVSPPDQISYSKLAHLTGMADLVRHEPAPANVVSHVPRYSSLDASLTTIETGIVFDPSETIVRKEME